MVFDFVIVEK